MSKSMLGSTIKSIIFFVVGASLGLTLFVLTANSIFLFVSFLGGFIGLALSWPSTSISNIARFTTEVLVSNNLPGAGEAVSKQLFGKEQSAASPRLYSDLPKIEPIKVTPEAIERLRQKLPNPDAKIRIAAKSNPDFPGFFLYNMGFDSELKMLEFDRAFSVEGLHFVVHLSSVSILQDITLHYTGGENDSFEFSNSGSDFSKQNQGSRGETK